MTSSIAKSLVRDAMPGRPFTWVAIVSASADVGKPQESSVDGLEGEPSSSRLQRRTGSTGLLGQFKVIPTRRYWVRRLQFFLGLLRSLTCERRPNGSMFLDDGCATRRLVELRADLPPVGRMSWLENRLPDSRYVNSTVDSANWIPFAKDQRRSYCAST
jgi:hypothetical protein